MRALRRTIHEVLSTVPLTGSDLSQRGEIHVGFTWSIRVMIYTSGQMSETPS